MGVLSSLRVFRPGIPSPRCVFASLQEEWIAQLSPQGMTCQKITRVLVGSLLVVGSLLHVVISHATPFPLVGIVKE